LAAASAVEEARKVPHFTGISASDGIEVHANSTSADGSSSLILSASPKMMSHVRSYVDVWGTLILSRVPGGGSSRVVAKAVVPGPLTYAGATSGGKLFADHVAGSVVASSYADIKIRTLEASKAISIVSTSHSSLSVDGGNVPFLSASCSDVASMRLGELRADSATVSVSSRSSLAGMTVGSATVSVSSSSSLTMTATHSVGLSCSSSEVHLRGGAKVTPYSNWACRVNLADTKEAGAAAAAASVPPHRRLRTEPVLV